MNWIKQLNDELERGFSKSDLEKLIGLPKNNLGSILRGKRVLSKISTIKIDRYFAAEKIDPLEYSLKKKRKKTDPIKLTKVETIQTRDDKKDNVEIPHGLSFKEKMEWYKNNRK